MFFPSVLFYKDKELVKEIHMFKSPYKNTNDMKDEGTIPAHPVPQNPTTPVENFVNEN